MLRDSGRVVAVGADETIVDALAAHGIEIAVSCSQGVCGTCLTGVLEGEVDHRDLYLSDEKKARHDQMLPCCSRARGANRPGLVAVVRTRPATV